MCRCRSGTYKNQCDYPTQRKDPLAPLKNHVVLRRIFPQQGAHKDLLRWASCWCGLISSNMCSCSCLNGIYSKPLRTLLFLSALRLLPKLRRLTILYTNQVHSQHCNLSEECKYVESLLMGHFQEKEVPPPAE